MIIYGENSIHNSLFLNACIFSANKLNNFSIELLILYECFTFVCNNFRLLGKLELTVFIDFAMLGW